MTLRFLCVGDLDVDLMVAVACLPGSAEKISGQRLGLTPGGMAANVAVGLRRLGADASLAAAVGDDENGRLAEQALLRERVDTRFLVRRAGEPTFMCVVLLTPDGEKSLVRLETGAYLPAPEDIPDAAFAACDHVHVTYGSEPLARSSIERAKLRGQTVSLDLESADIPAEPGTLLQLLTDVEWLFVNGATRRHLEQAFGKDALAAVPCVVTTLGAQGCQLERGETRIAVPGRAVVARDSTGAGDAFVAAFLHARLVERRTEMEALDRANAAAALAVQAVGAQSGLPTLADLESYLQETAPKVGAGAHRGRHA